MLALSATFTIVAGACSNNAKSPVVSLEPDSIGVCLQFDKDHGPEITDLPTVDCAESHSHEIIAIPESTAKVYPGFEALETEAQAACLAAFEDYVGTNPFDSDLFTSWLVPTLTSWEGKDRQIVCVVGNGNGAPLVGTVHQSAL